MGRKYAPVLAALSLLAICSPACVKVMPVQEIPLVSKEQLKSLMLTSKVVVVDVRHEAFWSESPTKIQGAVRGDGKSISWARDYPRDTLLVLYCAGGKEQTSTGQARKLMDKLYTNVRVLTGGWTAWTAAGFPVEPK